MHFLTLLCLLIGLFSCIAEAATLPSFDTQQADKRRAAIDYIKKYFGSDTPFFFEAKKVDEICARYEISKEELLKALIPIVKHLALPPISEYYVGATALGKSGNIYVGVNLEFKECPLLQAVHGEQFLIVNARNHNETELVAIALSAAPCGHCRQFLHEMGATVDDDLQICIPNHEPKSLGYYLPEPFGPNDLNVTGRLMIPPATLPPASNSLQSHATVAALASYAPYTTALSGVAIKTKDGHIVRGSYLENAAYNPSLSPLQSALVALVSGLYRYEDISEVYLVENNKPISQAASTKIVLQAIAPTARFKVEKLK